jgi:hypothetical protein
VRWIPSWWSTHEQRELGAVLVLVWCCGCCGCCGAGAVVLVLWCWSTRVPGRLVLHTLNYFIPPPGFWWLDTSLHAFDDQLLACLVAWPARLVLGRYLWVWVMLIRSRSWWLWTVLPFHFDCHLYYPGGISLCIFLCVQVIRRMKKKRRKIWRSRWFRILFKF